MSSNARNPKLHASRSGIGNPASDDRTPQQISPVEQIEKDRRWLAENADAIRAENDYIERHGLPLAKYRLF